MKTAISIPDATHARAEQAAKALGMSRSEFYRRAAERWLDTLDAEGTTVAIDLALEGLEDENAFAATAAASLAAADDGW